MFGLTNSDLGIALEIIGFLFAFGSFRVWFYMVYEAIKREIIFRSYFKRYSKTEEYKSRRSNVTGIKGIWRLEREIANDWGVEYHKTHLSKLTGDEEKHWPALKNILKFIGWLLITIGLSLQFSIFQ